MENAEQDKDFVWKNIKVSYLTTGDVVDMNNFKITFRKDKKNIKGRE